jgi:Rhomboid family
MLFYYYRTIATPTFLFIYFFTGVATWVLARDSYHIGMSGVIYGLTSFLVVSGFYRKNMKISAISLVVIFLYGSTVWGIFPNEPNISWEGHAFGMFGGLTIAYYFRNKGPQPVKMRYEIEEELGIEPEHEYWKTAEKQMPQQPPKIIINYTIVPKEIKVETEQSPHKKQQS